MANPNEFMVFGWNSQSLGMTAGQTGYAQPFFAGEPEPALYDEANNVLLDESGS